jgi:CHAT domain-containing protein/Flp pilus assembly protein TadD
VGWICAGGVIVKAESVSLPQVKDIMKYTFLWILAIVATIASAQQVDSMAIKQVDSLIQASRELTASGEFDQALEVNALAETIALEKLGPESAEYGSCAFNRGRINIYLGDLQEAEKWYLEATTIQAITLGNRHPEYASSLNILAYIYTDIGKYELAEPLYFEAIAIQENTLGKEHPAYASSLNSLAILYKDMGNYEKAEPLYHEAKIIRKKVLGIEHPDYASSLNSLAILYKVMGNYEKAEPLYLEAKDIWGNVLGVEHPHYAASLNNLANLYQDLGNYEKAETLQFEAKAIREKMLGKEHPLYAQSLNNLAFLYLNMGYYEKAEPLFLEAKNIRGKALGKDHPDYAQSLNNLAILYMDTGNYEKAEPLYLESKGIREKVLGIEHPDYASSLNNLAGLYMEMGNYQKAEPFFLEAKDIRGKALGVEHPNYAASLNNLAVLYMDMGNFEKAEPLYHEAKDIRGKALGKEHPNYAASLNNLAHLYKNMGANEKAESLYLETKGIQEKALGKEHPDYAGSLYNLAILYLDLGNYEKAEALYLEAKDIWGKVLGKEHPDYASSLNTMANIYLAMGNYHEAELLYLEAKAIREKVLGKEHPDYATSLNNLADLYERQSRFLEAESLIEEARTHSQSRMVNATSFLSERELANYTATFQNNGDNLSAYLLARQAAEAEPGILPTLAYDHALFYKGFLLTAATRLNAPKVTSPESMEINLRLKGYHRRLAAEYAKPIAERKGIADLEEKANIAEKELARTVAGYAEALRQVKWQEVKAGLKQSEAAIEFVHFQVNFPDKTDSTMYAALLILPGAEQPKFIPLFEEKALALLVSSNTERKADYVNELYTLVDRGLIKLGTAKSSLYDLIWKPLEDDLSGITSIYFSPSGLLHRINIDAIPVSEMETIADKYQLISLNSTRQIVIPTQINTNNDAILFGGIQFEQDSTIQNNEPLLASRFRGDLSFASVDSTLRGGTWNYLAGTEREVNAIEKMMLTSGINPSLKKGYEATEETFKNIGINNAPSPRILHIATHGYFFPDPKSTVKSAGLSGEQESVFKISDHPMLRSGLILAGGNAAWQGHQTLEGREDGILTAYEISQMNLSNTELVVLSACETGLGEIQGNEGVYGLQRAFKIAGAKYLIMSLWQVPDKQTSLLMTTFYKKWLEEKMTIPEAFHAAQKQLRDNGLDPYNWAGFVLVE